MRKWLLVGVAASLLFALPAAADTVIYTLTGTLGTLTFSLPVNPSVTNAGVGSGFEIPAVSTNTGADDIYFYNSGNDGGLSDVNLGYSLLGAQLYTGSELNPTMLAGTFTFSQGTGEPATLVATEIPEPASLLLLGSGLLGLGFRLRKRRA